MPVAQAVHVVEPATLDEPAGQGVHDATPMPPDNDENVPAGQLMQDVTPTDTFANLPAAQGAQPARLPAEPHVLSAARIIASGPPLEFEGQVHVKLDALTT